MSLKIGYHIKYYDPKDMKEKTGLVISFDENMVVVWNQELQCPYGLPRVCQIPEPEIVPSMVEIKHDEDVIITITHYDKPMIKAEELKACQDYYKKNYGGEDA